MKLFCLSVALLMPLVSFAQVSTDRLPPKWLYGHVPDNIGGIEYKVVSVPYSGYGDVNASALNELIREWGKTSTITQSTVQTSTSSIERSLGKKVNGSRNQVSVETISEDGEPVTVTCMLVDDWLHKKGVGQEYCAVYQLATRPNARFQSCTVTTSYGAAPVFMSLIPGAGQFYKGDPLKGGLLMGGCILGGAGIVFLESQRNAFAAARAQTHDVNLIKKYAADEKNLGIARNVTIGVSAALYLYNLIDAAVAPGARRIQVTPTGVSYSF